VPIFTTADRDAIKAAMVTFATQGFATVTVGGQTVGVKSLDELRRMFDMVQADLASANSLGGMRFRKTIPPGAG
jgi:hypothetical protein